MPVNGKVSCHCRVASFIVDLLCQSMESKLLLASRIVYCRFAMPVNSKVSFYCWVTSFTVDLLSQSMES